jgi:hypothetical protein
MNTLGYAPLPAVLAVSLLASACGAGSPTAPAAPSPPLAPGISIPVAIAEGRPQPDTEPPLPPLRTEAPPAARPDLPDPEPLRLDRQWEYEITYDHGQILVTRVRPLLFAQPVVTQRRVGRYAIELWIGHELIDRVRFDFPVIAAEVPLTDAPRHPLHEPASLAPGATVRRVLLVPASPRATRALLVDRATGEAIELPWPPDAPLPPPDAAGEAEPVPASSTAPRPSTPPAADLPTPSSVSPAE